MMLMAINATLLALTAFWRQRATVVASAVHLIKKNFQRLLTLGGVHMMFAA
jgi:hypothetical protein